MFDALRNRIHVKLLHFKKVKDVPKPTGKFVNPYAPKGKLSPYATEYGEKKPKSMKELISEKFGKKETPVVKESVVPVAKEPSIFNDMKVFCSNDILFLASKMGVPKRKEKSMSASEIAKACEGVKW